MLQRRCATDCHPVPRLACRSGILVLVELKLSGFVGVEVSAPDHQHESLVGSSSYLLVNL
jgi:hypothetical protein